MIFYAIFAHKFKNKNQHKQKIMNKNIKVDISNYNSIVDAYASLKKGEKSKLLNYLSRRYELSSSTMVAKFNHRATFTRVEQEIMVNVFNNQELWNN